MLGDDYVTSTQLASYLSIPTNSVVDPGRDAKISSAIRAATRAIEGHCGRQFNTDGITSQRTYAPYSYASVTVDDFYDASTVVVERRLWRSPSWQVLDTNFFEFRPFNGVVSGQAGWPFWQIVFIFWGVCSPDRIRVTAKWGWPSVPDAVKQATLILAAKYFKLSDAPLGTASFGPKDVGRAAGLSPLSVQDVPDVWGLLSPYVISPLGFA